LRERVSDRAVVITGASSGIGEALANRLGDAGAKVVLVARSADKLQEMKQGIEARGGTAFVYSADLSDAEDTQRLIASVLAEHGQIDVLVNNAGISIRRSVAKSYDRVHDFERTLALNFLGAVRLIMGFLPGMRAQKQGQILNVSTIGVQVNPPRYGAYIASKAALDAFSRVLGVEAHKDGVKVTTIYMPLVKTPMMKSTTIYDAFPMRSAEQAVDLIVEGIIHQRSPTALPRTPSSAFSTEPINSTQSRATRKTSASPSRETPRCSSGCSRWSRAARGAAALDGASRLRVYPGREQVLPIRLVGGPDPRGDAGHRA
jgi:short-subunit dehydrogenase